MGRLGEQDDAKKIRKTHYSVHAAFLISDISDLSVISYCKCM